MLDRLWNSSHPKFQERLFSSSNQMCSSDIRHTAWSHIHIPFWSMWWTGTVSMNDRKAVQLSSGLNHSGRLLRAISPSQLWKTWTGSWYVCKASAERAGHGVASDWQHSRLHQAFKKFHVQDHREFLPGARKSSCNSNNKARRQNVWKSCVSNELWPGFQS